MSIRGIALKQNERTSLFTRAYILTTQCNDSLKLYYYND